jgi:hypothetical protein
MRDSLLAALKGDIMPDKQKFNPVVLVGALIGFVVSMCVLHLLPPMGLMSAVTGAIFGALGASVGGAGAKAGLALFANKDESPQDSPPGSELFDSSWNGFEPLPLEPPATSRELEPFDISAIALTAAFLVVLTLGSFFIALIPSLATAAIMAVIYLAAPIRFRPLATAYAVLGGHAVFMVIGGLLSGHFEIVGIDLIIIGAGLTALVAWPGLITVGLMTIYQAFSLGSLLFVYLGVARGPKLADNGFTAGLMMGLVVNLALRVYSLVWLWRGWRRMVLLQPVPGHPAGPVLIAQLAATATEAELVSAEMVEASPASDRLTSPARISLLAAAAAVVLSAFGAGAYSLIAALPLETNIPALAGGLAMIIASVVGLALYHHRETQQRSEMATFLAMSGVAGNVAAIAVVAFTAAMITASRPVNPRPPGQFAGPAMRPPVLPNPEQPPQFQPQFQPQFPPQGQSAVGQNNPSENVFYHVFDPPNPGELQKVEFEPPARLIADGDDNLEPDAPRFVALRPALADRDFLHPLSAAVWRPDGEHLFIADAKGKIVNVRKNDWKAVRSLRLSPSPESLFWANDSLAVCRHGLFHGLANCLQVVLIDPNSLQPTSVIEFPSDMTVEQVSGKPGIPALFFVARFGGNLGLYRIELEPHASPGEVLSAKKTFIAFLKYNRSGKPGGYTITSDGSSALLLTSGLVYEVGAKPGDNGIRRSVAPALNWQKVMTTGHASRILCNTPVGALPEWQMIDASNLRQPLGQFTAYGCSAPDIDPKTGEPVFFDQGALCVRAGSNSARFGAPFAVAQRRSSGQFAANGVMGSSARVAASPAGDGALASGDNWIVWAEWPRGGIAAIAATPGQLANVQQGNPGSQAGQSRFRPAPREPAVNMDHEAVYWRRYDHAGGVVEVVDQAPPASLSAGRCDPPDASARITAMKLVVPNSFHGYPSSLVAWSPNGEHLYAIDPQGKVLDVRKRDWNFVRSLRLQPPPESLFVTKDLLGICRRARLQNIPLSLQVLFVDPATLQPVKELDFPRTMNVNAVAAAPASNSILAFGGRSLWLVDTAPAPAEGAEVEAELKELPSRFGVPRMFGMLADGTTALTLENQLCLTDLRPGHMGLIRQGPAPYLLAARCTAHPSRVLCQPQVTSTYLLPRWQLFDSGNLKKPVAEFAAAGCTAPDVDPRSGDALYAFNSTFCALAGSNLLRLRVPLEQAQRQSAVRTAFATGADADTLPSDLNPQRQPAARGNRVRTPRLRQPGVPEAASRVLAHPAGNGALVLGSNWSLWIEWDNRGGSGTTVSPKDLLSGAAYPSAAGSPATVAAAPARPAEKIGPAAANPGGANPGGDISASDTKEFFRKWNAIQWRRETIAFEPRSADMSRLIRANSAQDGFKITRVNLPHEETLGMAANFAAWSPDGNSLYWLDRPRRLLGEIKLPSWTIDRMMHLPFPPEYLFFARTSLVVVGDPAADERPILIFDPAAFSQNAASGPAGTNVGAQRATLPTRGPICGSSAAREIWAFDGSTQALARITLATHAVTRYGITFPPAARWAEPAEARKSQELAVVGRGRTLALCDGRYFHLIDLLPTLRFQSSSVLKGDGEYHVFTGPDRDRFICAGYTSDAVALRLRKWSIYRADQMDASLANFSLLDCSIAPGLDPATGEFVVLHDKTVQIYDPSKKLRRSLHDASREEKKALLPKNPHTILVHSQGGRALIVGEDGSTWIEWEAD